MDDMTETTDVAVGEMAGAGLAATAQVVQPRRPRAPFLGIRRTAGGVGAVGVKELRGRMRGRRAFVILTLYLVLLAGFAWMLELIMERTSSTGFGGNAALASPAIGQGIFAGLLMLETLMVAFLAPMATAGSISLEREKQTLEMLAATPISSFAIVLGKLLSALIYVWLLIAASIPLTAVVFVFSGVAPEDVVSGYIVLVVTALGFGSFGLFCSSLVKRTQAATAITIFGVLAVSMGTLFVIFFWQALASTNVGRGAGPIRGSAPDPIVYLNPFLAQADVAPAEVLCATDNSLRYYCRFRSIFVLDQSGVIFLGNDVVGTDGVILKRGIPGPVGAGGGQVNLDPELSFPVPVDQPLRGGGPALAGVAGIGADGVNIWEKTVVAWLVLSMVFLVLSVQLVSPTRRWHLRRGQKRRADA
jgi:ABC-type transport system involved in multi-copper enzyme maturation permease subunit